MCFVIAANFHMDGRTSKATAFKNYFTNNISIFVSRHLKNEKKNGLLYKEDKFDVQHYITQTFL